jgi:hypothetical protein
MLYAFPTTNVSRCCQQKLITHLSCKYLPPIKIYSSAAQVQSASQQIKAAPAAGLGSYQCKQQMVRCTHPLTQYSVGVSVARAIELTKLQFPLFWRVCDSNNIGMQQRRPQRMQLFTKHITCSNAWGI